MPQENETTPIINIENTIVRNNLNFYHVLGLKPSERKSAPYAHITQNEIKKAYHTRARETHTDKICQIDITQQYTISDVNMAWEILKNEAYRKLFDSDLKNNANKYVKTNDLPDIFLSEVDIKSDRAEQGASNSSKIQAQFNFSQTIIDMKMQLDDIWDSIKNNSSLCENILANEKLQHYFSEEERNRLTSVVSNHSEDKEKNPPSIISDLEENKKKWSDQKIRRSEVKQNKLKKEKDKIINNEEITIITKDYFTSIYKPDELLNALITGKVNYTAVINGYTQYIMELLSNNINFFDQKSVELAKNHLSKLLQYPVKNAGELAVLGQFLLNTIKPIKDLIPIDHKSLERALLNNTMFQVIKENLYNIPVGMGIFFENQPRFSKKLYIHILNKSGWNSSNVQSTSNRLVDSNIKLLEYPDKLWARDKIQKRCESEVVKLLECYPHIVLNFDFTAPEWLAYFPLEYLMKHGEYAELLFNLKLEKKTLQNYQPGISDKIFDDYIRLCETFSKGFDHTVTADEFNDMLDMFKFCPMMINLKPKNTKASIVMATHYIDNINKYISLDDSISVFKLFLALLRGYHFYPEELQRSVQKVLATTLGMVEGTSQKSAKIIHFFINNNVPNEAFEAFEPWFFDGINNDPEIAALAMIIWAQSVRLVGIMSAIAIFPFSRKPTSLPRKERLDKFKNLIKNYDWENDASCNDDKIAEIYPYLIRLGWSRDLHDSFSQLPDIISTIIIDKMLSDCVLYIPQDTREQLKNLQGDFSIEERFTYSTLELENYIKNSATNLSLSELIQICENFKTAEQLYKKYGIYQTYLDAKNSLLKIRSMLNKNITCSQETYDVRQVQNFIDSKIVQYFKDLVISARDHSKEPNCETLQEFIETLAPSCRNQLQQKVLQQIYKEGILDAGFLLCTLLEEKNDFILEPAIMAPLKSLPVIKSLLEGGHANEVKQYFFEDDLKKLIDYLKQHEDFEKYDMLNQLYCKSNLCLNDKQEILSELKICFTENVTFPTGFLHPASEVQTIDDLVRKRLNLNDVILNIQKYHQFNSEAFVEGVEKTLIPKIEEYAKQYGSWKNSDNELAKEKLTIFNDFKKAIATQLKDTRRKLLIGGDQADIKEINQTLQKNILEILEDPDLSDIMEKWHQPIKMACLTLVGIVLSIPLLFTPLLSKTYCNFFFHDESSNRLNDLIEVASGLSTIQASV